MKEKFPNQHELERKFPYVGDDVFQKRLSRIKSTLKLFGYACTGQDEDRIYFEKHDDKRMYHSSKSFGLWQIAHETDADFEYGLEKHIWHDSTT